MEIYITPEIIKYKNVDNLLEKNKEYHTPFSKKENLLMENLLQENFICIVGEPGIGKSRLINEIKQKIPTQYWYCTASTFNLDNLVHFDKEYCIIDALDEVEEVKFYETFVSIKKFKEKKPNVKLLFSCRKHYVASYAKLFSVCKDLKFIELCRLSDENVDKIIGNMSDMTKKSLYEKSKLKELLSIPRYLTFLLEYDKKNGGCSNVGELFEYMINCSIKTAIEQRENINYENMAILIKRVLEKIAFIMEISHKDQISKDDLYTILDKVDGNMTHMLIANFDLLFFESRILKDTNGILQFHNTEVQEYLAAKELCRQDNVESVLYDVAVQKELKHIYPNWYDVIPHISYIEDRIHTFINILKLIVSYESNIENESFESLLKYVDSSILSDHEKEDLFTIVLQHYLRVPAYIQWRSSMLKLMQECYTSNCSVRIMLSSERLNKIQLTNIYNILEAIVENNKLDKNVYDHWVDIADVFITSDDNEKQLIGLHLYNSLRSEDKFIHLSKNCNGFSEELKEKYYQITGYRRYTSKDIVNCWLNGCVVNNSYAINAILYIEDSSTIMYAYNKLISSNNIINFFNNRNSLLVLYAALLKNQFDIVWDVHPQNKITMARVIAGFVNSDAYTTNDSIINAIVKKILCEEQTGAIFLENIEYKWKLEDLFQSFDIELIDINFLHILDGLLHSVKYDDFYTDNILIAIIDKIRKDEGKKTYIVEYINRYADIFELWDKNSKKIKGNKVNPHEQHFINIYQILSEPDVPKYNKYKVALELSKNIQFIQQQDSQPYLDIIEQFFNEIDLNEMSMEKKGENSFTLSISLVKIPYYVRALHYLNRHDFLIKYRDILAKTLPIVCSTTNLEAHELKEIYKSVIGSFSDDEKKQLVEWWKHRKDDFMNISYQDVFTCITDYGIEALSYKLEEYIEQYIADQNINNRFAASKALDIISDGYCNWDISKYKHLFNSLTDENLDSIKMQCNAIMIEKFKDDESILWRLEYIKSHPVRSIHNRTGEFRFISIEESEMIRSNPYMFRCFMNIGINEKLAEQMLNLFDYGLELSVNYDMQEYSRYILNQVYLYFVHTYNINYMSILKKKVEKFNVQNVSFLANNIMNSAEMLYISKEKITINYAIKQYNKCVEESHLNIRNDGDLRRYFAYILSEVHKEIQDQGIYSLVSQKTLSEDFIQRELKNTIINKCCQIGLEVRVDREVALQDNKRPDLLIRYGLCNPIFVELKLLNNKEIQNNKQRHEYKNKFIQYMNATNPCLSVFWVFNVHKNRSNFSKFKELEDEYRDLDNTKVLLTDCKCSSGINTALPKNKKVLKKTVKE